MKALTGSDRNRVSTRLRSCTSPPRATPGEPTSGRRRRRQRAATVVVAATALALPWLAGTAQAAGPEGAVPADMPTPELPPPPTPPTVPALVGVDVSHPQCDKSLPAGQAFAVIGVTGGNAASTNPCLASQLAWGTTGVGGTVHDDVQLYVNTGNPGGSGLWPESGSNRYGDCDGSSSRPCAYQYGWERARDDATIRGIAHPAEYMWWLDVEIANTWDYSDGGHTRNAAVLEGMTDYFTSLGVRGVGLYSTRYQWDHIVGNGVSSTSSLNGLSNWRPTGDSLDGAQRFCGLDPLTPGGIIEMTQYTTDYDY